MKKIALWIGVLTAFVLGMLSVSAASTDTAVPADKQTAIIIGDVTVEPGTATVKVPVYVKLAENFTDGLRGVQCRITYDNTKLTFKKVKWTDDLEDTEPDIYSCKELTTKDTIEIILAYPYDGVLLEKNLYVCDLPFTVKDTFTSGTSALTFDSSEVKVQISVTPERFATYALYDGSITIQAAAVEHTVTFADGGHGTLTTASQNVEENVATALPELVNDGVYKFAGWTDGTNLYPKGATITTDSDVELTAIWFADITTDSGYIAASASADQKTYAIGIQAELNASIFDTITEFGFYYYIPETGEANAAAVSSDAFDALKTNNGKFYTYIVDIPTDSTEILVKSYIKVGDAYVYGAYQTYTPANAAKDAAPKYLGKNY